MTSMVLRSDCQAQQDRAIGIVQLMTFLTWEPNRGFASMQVGTVTDVRFTNISAVAEAGIVVAGSPGSTIEGLVLEGLQLELTRQTDIPGGFLDYRPGLRGLVDDVTTSAIFLEHANHATLSNVEVRAPGHLVMVFQVSPRRLVSMSQCASLLDGRYSCCN